MMSNELCTAKESSNYASLAREYCSFLDCALQSDRSRALGVLILASCGLFLALSL